MNYTYIFAPKNAQNIAVFDYALTEYPELVEQKRYKTTRIKTPDDIVILEQNIFSCNGPEFLQIKAITVDIPAELIAQIDSPDLITEPADVIAKYW